MGVFLNKNLKFFTDETWFYAGGYVSASAIEIGEY
jgi:hypothetical protein